MLLVVHILVTPGMEAFSDMPAQPVSGDVPLEIAVLLTLAIEFSRW